MKKSQLIVLVGLEINIWDIVGYLFNSHVAY